MEEDRQLPRVRRTGELANTICPYLQMEVHYPSNHPSGYGCLSMTMKPMATCYVGHMVNNLKKTCLSKLGPDVPVESCLSQVCRDAGRGNVPVIVI